jgi:hypothetical protein
VVNDWAWGQFALIGWVAACLFAAGARSKGIAMNRRTWLEIAQAAVIVVLLFALLSEGRGCSRFSTVDPDALCVGEAQC